MGVADRLIASDAAGGPIAPGAIARDGSFDSISDKRDVRPNRVQTLTLAGYGSGDKFAITGELNGYPLGNTPLMTKGASGVTGAEASDVQAALRTLTGDSGLTVTEGASGVFTITHTKATFSRHFPRYGVSGASGITSSTFGFDADAGEGDATIGLLGESHYVKQGGRRVIGGAGATGVADSILAPTIGTITVVHDTTDEVQLFTPAAGTDGGSVAFAYKGRTSGLIAFDADLQDLQAALDDAFAAGGFSGDAPTVTFDTPLSLEVQFNDWDTTDSAILTFDTTDASDALLFATLTAGASAAAREAIIEAWVKTIDRFADATVTVSEVTEDQEYDVVFNTSYGVAAADFALAVTGTTNEDTSPDENTAFDYEAGITFTFENGDLAGTPVGGAFAVFDDQLTDGGVADPGALTVTTPGAYGDISAAYTENGNGDSVIGAAVHDGTGKSYGFQVDAATPVVIGSLPAGAYHLVLRTVEDGRVSKAASKAFTIA